MRYSFLILAIFSLLLISCSDIPERGKKILGTNYKFTNQNELEIELDSLLKNKITLMGFIYTHCPDICPMTTHNMYLTQKLIDENNIKNLRFILVTFDPIRDNPSVLKSFASVRDIDTNRWNLLTGEPESVRRFNKMMGINSIAADSSYSEDGELNYYIIHTDRITLIDKDGFIRSEYKGSLADPQLIFDDIKKIGE
ncbi:MAG: SCO family protein [Ignavibacteriales bacterium]|nr:MAG: SCO family protein [Ignavibacteriales bacterium]